MFNSRFRNHYYFKKEEKTKTAATTAFGADQLNSALDSITGALEPFSVEMLIIVLVAGLTVTVGPVLVRFAYRWVKGKLQGAFFKGKL